jgi:DNA-binding transcriptional ArsR family regulator
MSSSKQESIMDFQADELAEIFSIFSNAKRIQIFWSLDGTEKSVNEIAQAINSSMQNTSQHLRLMKAQNIVESRRNGQSIYYRIADSDIAVFCRFLQPQTFKGYLEATASKVESEDLPIHEDQRTLA